MREVHIKIPIWNGLPDSPRFLSVANFRVVNSKGIPFKGNILIFCDWKVKDKNNPDTEAPPILMWRYPFIMKCEDVIKYPPSWVGEGYRRTKVHTIPVNDMKVYETRRKRIMSQADFESLKMASLAVKREQEIKNAEQ
jgi:hypothetical protein